MGSTDLVQEPQASEVDPGVGGPQGQSSGVVCEALGKMPNLLARGLLYVVLLLVAALFAYSLVAKVDVVVSARMVLRADRSPGEFLRQVDAAISGTNVEPRLFADIILANKDAGRAVVGMPARYKFDAYPFLQYGTIKAKLVAVADEGVEDPRLGWVFHAKGALPSNHLIVDGKKYDLKAGMTGTAELVAGRATLFSILLGRLSL